MSEIVYPVLTAPHDGAPLYPTDLVVVAGRRLSAAQAIARFSAADLQAAGYGWPTLADLHGSAAAAVLAAATAAQESAAAPYAWPEAAAWSVLERDARAWLDDPTGPPGPDLLADLGEADPTRLTTRAAAIVARADAFRARRGEIVRLRRDGLAAVDAASTEGDLRAAAAAAVAAFEAVG